MSDTTEFRFTYDGVEYVAPAQLTPAESNQLRKWSDGMLSGGMRFIEALGDGDPAAWAAAIVIAMRRNGVDASWEAFMNDADILVKVGTVDVEGDAVPPTSPEPDLNGEAIVPDSMSTPVGIGSPS